MTKKKGEKYTCKECGIVILVEDPCGCEECDIICCGEPMKPVQVTKTKPKAQAKLKTK